MLYKHLKISQTQRLSPVSVCIFPFVQRSGPCADDFIFYQFQFCYFYFLLLATVVMWAANCDSSFRFLFYTITLRLLVIVRLIEFSLAALVDI